MEGMGKGGRFVLHLRVVERVGGVPGDGRLEEVPSTIFRQLDAQVHLEGCLREGLGSIRSRVWVPNIRR